MNNDKKGFLELMMRAVETISEISGCGRVCFIAVENGEFIVRAGVPEGQHGIGIALDENSGKNFLTDVMNKKKMVFVGHPKSDSRVFYMKYVMIAQGIDAILFAPMYYENENIGVIVVDAVGESEKRNLDAKLRILKKFVTFCAKTIGREIEIRKNNAKALEIAKEHENFCALGRHAAGIGHHFRTSLQIIGGFTEREMGYLEKKASLYENNPEMKKFFADVSQKLGIINHEMKRLARYVDDIMTFVKVQDCVKLKKERLNRILREELDIIRDRGGKVKIFPQLEKCLNKMFVMVDAVLFSSAIKDIVSNAIQAKADAILVKTELDPAKSVCKIIIANNGEMIPPKDMDEIFSPFFTTKKDGTGLGLSNAAAIIEAHGGKLMAKSGESDNNSKNHNTHFGTRFEISLPLPVENKKE